MDSSGFISPANLEAFLEKTETLPDVSIDSKPMMLTNSGESGRVVTDEYDIKLTNTVLSDRKTVSADLVCKHEAEGNSSTVSANIKLRSGEAVVVGGYAVGKGSKAYFIIQVEVLRLK